MPHSHQSFGRLLRTHREAKGIKASAVAKKLGISLVYYRDVECSRRKPFSRLKVSLDVLAHELGIDVAVLTHAAAVGRGQLEFDFKEARADERAVAILFARAITTRKLTKARLRRLEKLLQAQAS